jgi:hypothetical protein
MTKQKFLNKHFYSFLRNETAEVQMVQRHLQGRHSVEWHSSEWNAIIHLLSLFTNFCSLAWHSAEGK